jgi:urease accessory protein UreF
MVQLIDNGTGENDQLSKYVEFFKTLNHALQSFEGFLTILKGMQKPTETYADIFGVKALELFMDASYAYQQFRTTQWTNPEAFDLSKLIATGRLAGFQAMLDLSDKFGAAVVSAASRMEDEDISARFVERFGVEAVSPFMEWAKAVRIIGEM